MGRPVVAFAGQGQGRVSIGFPQFPGRGIGHHEIFHSPFGLEGLFVLEGVALRQLRWRGRDGKAEPCRNQSRDAA